MSVKTSLGALAAFALAAVATAAKAEVPSCVAIDGIERVTVAVDGVARCFYKFDDRFYEVLVEAGISWDVAKQTAAARKGPNSLVGGLATISDPEEDEALFQMAKQNQPSGSRTHAWIGGAQDCTADPTCGWVMLHGQEIPPENNPGPTSFAARLARAGVRGYASLAALCAGCIAEDGSPGSPEYFGRDPGAAPVLRQLGMVSTHCHRRSYSAE